MHIEGQLAVISGGGSGLGEATARYLSEAGAKVLILDQDKDKVRRVAADTGGLDAQCDVTEPDAVSECLLEAIQFFDQVPRIVVNCAGIGNAARMVNRHGDVSSSLFRRVIDVNLCGTFNVMAYAAKQMLTAPKLESGERGVIINTASVAYQDGQVGQTAYAASKGAIAAMGLPAARELSGDGIRVMTIAPGLFQTPMMEALPEKTITGITQNIPCPSRLGTPVEYAKLVGHIVENAYLNGTVIRLDGAVRLPPR
ncbi:MAG: SDR family NAD(P)-dependent oxidoreductase [Aestuariivita sp.]|nr:SDR family NAD(P)-dependent oxidoreductase [Aestuariivita sp.]